jgi:hypothetical protein
MPRWVLSALAAALIAACALQGMRMVWELPMPPDVDSLRDISFAQAMLDGNYTGDPNYAGELRFYPPLIPALRALVFRLIQADDLPHHWIVLSPWLNLLAPIAFFAMARRLFGSMSIAVASLAVFVLLQGAVSQSYVTGGYTPWPLAPVLAQAGFFATIWLIAARVAAARWHDAPLIGAAIGATFLAHVVPSVLLTAIVTVAALTVQGFRLRTLGWLAVVAAAQVAVMAPYALPIFLHYPGGTVHDSAEWTYPIFAPTLAGVTRVVALNVPGLAALALLLLPFRRTIPAMRPLTIAILVTWIGVAGAFLLRHYGCGAIARIAGGFAPGACRVFVMPIHHYHFYLQSAWPLIIGFVGWHAARRWLADAPDDRRHGRRLVLAMLLLMAGVAGLARLMTRPNDLALRELVLTEADELVMDLAAYHWILRETPPDTLFVTDVPKAWYGAAAFSVMAAGRQIVAAPAFFSNPYVDWSAREARRLRYLAWFSGATGADAVPCEVVASGLWALLPNATMVAEGRAVATLRTASHTVWRALPAPGCSGSGPKG